jgi:NTE family protein
VTALIDALGRSTLLAGMPPALVGAIAAAVEPVEIGGGEVLFREGEQSDALYFVLSGRLRVQRAQAGGVRVIAEIVAGESVGEMAALTGDIRSATVVAIRNCRLARLKRAALERILGEHPQFLAPIAVLLARRLGGAGRAGQVRKAASCLTLVPACQGVDAAAVAAKLGAALGRHGSVAVVGAADAPAADFADWAQTLEARHDYILFVGGGETNDWSALCLRQADMVLVCADPARPPPARRAIPDWANVGLVLCRANDAAASHTGDWLDAFPGAVHFNLRSSVAGDCERLARLVSGHGVGLVLGGGGARGMAHIGVVRALAEAGIPIDRVGGTSQGALVAATAAIGWDDKTMLEVFGAFRDNNPTSDFTMPRISLIAGKKAERALQAQFGQRRIEDLPLDFFCVSSSLTSGQAHVHRRGLLWEALRASISIPGIFPPVARDGELLVDGGVLDNLPIGPMRQRGEIKVIAVNVTFAKGLAPRRARTQRRPSLFRWGKTGEAGYRLPSIVQTLMHAGTLNTVGRLDALRSAADLFIEPKVDGFRLLDWGRVEDIAEIGYRTAKEALARWDAA